MLYPNPDPLDHNPADDRDPCDAEGCEYLADYEVGGSELCERHYSLLEFDADGNPTNLEELLKWK